MRLVFEILTYLGAVAASFLIFLAFQANSAPQQGAVAAMAVAVVVVPYCVLATLQRNALIRFHLGQSANVDPQRVGADTRRIGIGIALLVAIVVLILFVM